MYMLDTGNEVKVCVFSGNEFHEEVKTAGADVIGDDQVLADISEGKIEFDKIKVADLAKKSEYRRIPVPRHRMTPLK